MDLSESIDESLSTDSKSSFSSIYSMDSSLFHQDSINSEFSFREISDSNINPHADGYFHNNFHSDLNLNNSFVDDEPIELQENITEVKS